MSTDLRIKKLRGSGGYVMAQVSDEQQRKGNLGGPDLFLAPIGRLDEYTIKKYSCNMCDKEYDGSPKIEYEHPNEQVADNLILVERGQYLCIECGSPIAEYREFQKSDESSDIGNAKPTEVSAEIFQELNNDTQEDSESIMNEIISENNEQFENVDKSLETNVESGDIDSTFSAITGKIVFDENAKQIGVAKQVGVNSKNEVVLVITDNYGDDKSVDWQKIKKIGEIVLLGNTEIERENIPAPDGLECSNCNFDNKSDAKFCENCGSKV
jgi:sporulation protein YlmC with PRC-barrel domain